MSYVTVDLVRSMALKPTPFVKLGESPPTSLGRRSGWLADVVARLAGTRPKRGSPKSVPSSVGFGARWRRLSPGRRATDDRGSRLAQLYKDVTPCGHY